MFDELASPPLALALPPLPPVALPLDAEVFPPVALVPLPPTEIATELPLAICVLPVLALPPEPPVAPALPPVAWGEPWAIEETLLCTCPTTGSGGVEAPAGAAATAMAALAARTAAMRFIVFLCSM